MYLIFIQAILLPESENENSGLIHWILIICDKPKIPGSEGKECIRIPTNQNTPGAGLSQSFRSWERDCISVCLFYHHFEHQFMFI